MNYRALGAWLESGYVVQADRPVSIKRFQWTQQVVCRPSGQTIGLEYGATSTIPIGRMEDYSYVAGVERECVGIVHAMIDEAVAGRAYIKKVSMAECLFAIQSQMIQGWVDAAGFTEAWRLELEASIQTANQKYREIIEACRTIGAQPSPEHDAWGWVVAIEPLSIPREALLVMPGAV